MYFTPLMLWKPGFEQLDDIRKRRGEGFNKKIHKVTNHQMPLEKAAEKIVEFTEDLFRDFNADNDIARVKKVMGIDRHYFYTLTVAKAGQFRKQYLLPCAHDLEIAYKTGIPIPKSLIHPRWWIEGHTPTTRDWQPSYEPIIPIIADRQQQPIQAQFNQVLNVKERLNQAEQEQYDQQVLHLLTQAREISEHREATLTPFLPNAIQRYFTKPIPTVNKRLRGEIKAKAKATILEEKDAKARALAAAESQGGTTITINREALPHRLRADITGPVHDSSSSSSESELEHIDDKPLRDLPPLDDIPPSTAPPRLEEGSRVKRARAVTINYTKLDAGDSQEYKKAKRR
ncbi:hypothetical protein H2198_006374 [Neophaeococcomyces mojaviensis]|uniref:Uncharacterized protein n=1 Tax=Neophaeococcomyces mojaviensis TaxID=3383035 RepID=A0ACC3A327_9EURO|nr:hypothetical protein H2198_006374 [Knufia sp. JES_112]